MARRTKTLQVWECDSKFCRSEDVVENGPPPGFLGTVSTGAEFGEPLDWYACRPAHIKDAVTGVLDRADDDENADNLV
jgi:hypothetical protein